MKSFRLIKLIFVYTAILNLLFLTGCWNYTEMDQQLNVAGIAIDKGQNGKKYHISVELINTGKDIGNNKITQVIEYDGNTILEAIRDMVTITSKKLYFGHCKTMIIGEEVAKGGFSPVLDFVFRDPEARISMGIVITRNCTAKDVLMSESIENPITAYEIGDLIQTFGNLGTKAFKLQAYQIVNMLETTGEELVIPALEITKVQDYETFKTGWCGVFDGDKLVGYLTDDERKIYTLINNKVKSSILNLSVPSKDNATISFEVYGSKIKIKPKLVDDKLAVDLFINTNVCIAEAGGSNNYVSIPERNTLEILLEEQMTNDVNKLINKAQTEFECDIFGIGKEIHDQKAKLWENYKDNWNDTFKNLNIDVKYNINIKCSGINKSSIKVGG